MKNMSILLFFLIIPIAFTANAGETFEEDIINTSSGELKITFIGHASLIFTFGGKVIHVDPWSRMADYSKLPKADMVLITHEHGDHLDLNALEVICDDKTLVVYTETCAEQLDGGIVMKNGDVKIIERLKIAAVPAYNINKKHPDGIPVHPKGIGNGYVITFGDKRVYIGAETENIPELKQLEDIDIAFMSMDSVYNMTPEIAAEAAKLFMPKILYPYHYGDSNISIIVDLLKGNKDIEVRIRNMQ